MPYACSDRLVYESRQVKAMAVTPRRRTRPGGAFCSSEAVTSRALSATDWRASCGQVVNQLIVVQ
eukprot:scaffold188670_cov17-Prasinocladus_malaysianus.AAC.1